MRNLSGDVRGAFNAICSKPGKLDSERNRGSDLGEETKVKRRSGNQNEDEQLGDRVVTLKQKANENMIKQELGERAVQTSV